MNSRRTALITGASSGLGRSLVELFASRNYHVVGISRTIKKNDRNTDLIEYVRCDIRNYDVLSRVASSIASIDVLINNAAVILQGAFSSYSPDKIREVIDTDLTGLILTTRAFIPLIPPRPGSMIVNIASTSGMIGRSNETVYCAAKFGVRGFTDALRVELAGTGIKVVGIYPGGMKTDLYSHAGLSVDTSHYMDPIHIASNILHIVEQPDNLSLDTIVINRMKR